MLAATSASISSADIFRSSDGDPTMLSETEELAVLSVSSLVLAGEGCASFSSDVAPLFVDIVASN